MPHGLKFRDLKPYGNENDNGRNPRYSSVHKACTVLIIRAEHATYQQVYGDKKIMARNIGEESCMERLPRETSRRDAEKSMSTAGRASVSAHARFVPDRSASRATARITAPMMNQSTGACVNKLPSAAESIF